MAYVVSKTIELDASRNNLQFAIQHLEVIRELIGNIPVSEVENSPVLSDLWLRIKRIDIADLCDDGIPF